jgi:hypothetical protein
MSDKIGGEFQEICDEIRVQIQEWEPKLSALPEATITNRKNTQRRSIRQIVGHMVDSATNNIHRVIHMHYQESPILYPDYANLGNNDRWITIQNYQEEDWDELVKLWASINRHIVHLIGQIDETKLNQYWISALNETVTLEEMITDYPRHFKLHLDEISALINQLTIEHD